MSDLNRIRTDELTTGARLVAKDMTRFTVDSVTPAKVDWRFQGRQSDGSYSSESGMEIVGHDEAGEVVRFTAAQSYLWYRDLEAEKLADAVATLGALPMPVGPEPQAPARGPLWSLLDWSLWGAGMGDTFREPLADAMLAGVSAETRAQAEQVMADFIERRKIEKTGVTVWQEQRDELARLRGEVAALRAERHTTNEALSDAAVGLREREASPLTVFRASHDSIVMGLYTTREAARQHCETLIHREEPFAQQIDWYPDTTEGDNEEAPEGLFMVVAGEESDTGYVVTPLSVASAYDPDADE